MKTLRFRNKMNSLNTVYNIENRLQHFIKKTNILSCNDNPWMKMPSQFAFICLTSAVIMMFTVLYLAQDRSEVFESLSFLTFTGMALVKLKCLRSNKQTWIELLNGITRLEKQELQIEVNQQEYESDEETDISSDYIKKYTLRSKMLIRLISRFYISSLLIYIATPFLEVFLYKVIGSEKVSLPYVLPGWSILIQTGLFGYIIAVIIQMIAACYCVVIHIAFDIITVSLMIFGSAQFSLLKAYSERIAGSGKILVPFKKRDDRAHERIKKCHSIHVYIINYISKMSDLLKDILGVYYFVAAMTLCSIAFRLKTEELGVLQILSLLQYMCGHIIQLFMYCYYGDEVFNQSSVRVGEGPFAASFWCLGTKVRKELILLGIGMMRPRRISAGPFNYLDLPSFIQIVRAAYSYYAVLRK